MWRRGQLPSPQALAEEDELWGLDPTAREQLCRLWMAKLQEPLHTELAIPGSARASLYIYNTREEVDAFCAELEATIELFAGLDDGGDLFDVTDVAPQAVQSSPPEEGTPANEKPPAEAAAEAAEAATTGPAPDGFEWGGSF